MAAFTSKAPGNWSAGGTTTWVQAGVPGAGDTVSTTHAVVVDVDTIIGASPAAGGTAAIAASAPLSIAAGKSLTVRGDLKLTDTTLTLAAGAVLEFDASLAASPSTALYLLQIGTTHVQPNCKLICNGTAGARCTVRSNAGGANVQITDGGFIQAGQVDASYTDFTRIGDASHFSFQTWAQGDEGTFHLTQCVLDACGKMTSTVLNERGEFVLTNVTMKNTVASECLRTGTSDALLPASGLRSITHCVFDKTVELFSALDFTLDDVYFHNRLACTPGLPASCTNVFLRAATAAGTQDIDGSITDAYFLHDHTEINPHYLAHLLSADATLDGCIFEMTGTDGAGDCILGPSPGSAHILTVQNCIELPNAVGEDSGTLVTLAGNANLTVDVVHCVGLAGGQGMLAVGETYGGHTGMVRKFKNNIIYDTSARGLKMYDVAGGDNIPDLVAAVDADYNGGYSLLAGSNGKGYDQLEFSSGSPGAHDVTGDPGFVDAARDIAKWDLSLGGPGTVANALTNLRLKNEAGYNTNYTIAALVAYVKAGFAPTNADYHAADDNVSPSNGWIGAVQGGAPVAAITFTSLVSRRDALMRADSRVSVIINKPDATTDTTADAYLVKDPDPGDAAVTTVTVPGNAKGGDVGGARYSWKGYTYANLGTAYGLS